MKELAIDLELSSSLSWLQRNAHLEIAQCTSSAWGGRRASFTKPEANVGTRTATSGLKTGTKLSKMDFIWAVHHQLETNYTSLKETEKPI